MRPVTPPRPHVRKIRPLIAGPLSCSRFMDFALGRRNPMADDASPSHPGPRSRPKDTPWRSFVRMLLQTPLWAVPFAIFFGTLSGSSLKAYAGAYVFSLVFAYT